MARVTFRHVLIFLSLLNLSLAASRQSFCKCTCFTNSSLIPLTPPKHAASSSSNDRPATTGHSCADCNKDFCKNYGLAICADATDEDMFTTCFQRDSAKDEAVIYLFIAATVGLLVWAGVKPAVGRWRERGAGGMGRGAYGSVPVGGSGG